MPNASTFWFLDPRKIFFGVRLSFDFQRLANNKEKTMKTQKMKIGNLLLLVAVCISALIVVHTGFAQQIRWLRVTPLQTPINEIGAEFEGEFPAAATDILTWPAQYSINQTTLRARFLWIGCQNFDDPVEGKVKKLQSCWQ